MSRGTAPRGTAGKSLRVTAVWPDQIYFEGELLTYHLILGARGLTGRSGKSNHTPFLPKEQPFSGGTNMDRENKRKSFEKGCYKPHARTDAFTCRVCGRLRHRRLPRIRPAGKTGSAGIARMGRSLRFFGPAGAAGAEPVPAGGAGNSLPKPPGPTSKSLWDLV